MTRIDTNRCHSSTLDAKASAHLARWETKGYASVASALRVANVKRAIERIESAGLARHFAFVEIREGRFAGRVAPSLGFEAGAPVPSEAAFLIHAGILVISAD
jgi:hypothetical protein